MTSQKSATPTLSWALGVLGISGVQTESEILAAFRRKVKAASNGAGSYRAGIDMDDLTTAKDYLLKTLTQSQEQANRDRAREAEKQEAEQRRRRELQEQANRDRARQAEEEEAERRRQREQAAPHVSTPSPEPDQAKQRRKAEPSPEAEPEPSAQQNQAEPKQEAPGAQEGRIHEALRDPFRQIEERLQGLEHERDQARCQARQREEALRGAFTLVEGQLEELEGALQKARAVVGQIRMIVEAAAASDRAQPRPDRPGEEARL